MSRILLVEDDESIVHSLTDYLQLEGFYCENVDGEKLAKDKLEKNRYDLLLVDISLREGTGYGVCKLAKTMKLPVIFLTASGDETSVVRGFDIGADDYVAKPFRPRELVSRIKNILRHYEGNSGLVKIGDIFVDTNKCIVTRDNKEIALSALEYRLLNIFINNRGKVLTRNKLLEDIWDIAGDYVNDNTLTVYIKRLREKLEDDKTENSIITTVRGMGYKMD